MGKMVRKQVYLESRQDRLLKERARRYRVTEAELIRQALDRALTEGPSPAARLEAWERVRRFITRYRKPTKRRASKRGWTRDELYDRWR